MGRRSSMLTDELRGQRAPLSQCLPSCLDLAPWSKYGTSFSRGPRAVVIGLAGSWGTLEHVTHQPSIVASVLFFPDKPAHSLLAPGFITILLLGLFHMLLSSEHVYKQPLVAENTSGFYLLTMSYYFMISSSQLNKLYSVYSLSSSSEHLVTW